MKQSRRFIAAVLTVCLVLPIDPVWASHNLPAVTGDAAAHRQVVTCHQVFEVAKAPKSISLAKWVYSLAIVLGLTSATAELPNGQSQSGIAARPKSCYVISPEEAQRRHQVQTQVQTQIKTDLAHQVNAQPPHSPTPSDEPTVAEVNPEEPDCSQPEYFPPVLRTEHNHPEQSPENASNKTPPKSELPLSEAKASIQEATQAKASASSESTFSESLNTIRSWIYFLAVGLGLTATGYVGYKIYQHRNKIMCVGAACLATELIVNGPLRGLFFPRSRRGR